MRVLLAGVPLATAAAALECLGGAVADDGARARLRALAMLARRHRDGLAQLERMAAEGDVEHAPAVSAEAGIAAARAMFDRLVRISPEAAVAAYSLGDRRLLDEATAEVVTWLRGIGALAGRPAVLDLGCGIGRFCASLAPEAARGVGVDVAPAMVEAARARCAALENVRVEACSGRDLAGFGAGAFGLVLAVDVFPYFVQAGLVERHVAEAARVLRPGGSLVLVNFSYRDAGGDHGDVARLADRAGFAVLRDGERPFHSWDGAAWWLRLRGGRGA
jgi:SAM-dependent methyltransferase